MVLDPPEGINLQLLDDLQTKNRKKKTNPFQLHQNRDYFIKIKKKFDNLIIQVKKDLKKNPTYEPFFKTFFINYHLRTIVQEDLESLINTILLNHEASYKPLSTMLDYGEETARVYEKNLSSYEIFKRIEQISSPDIDPLLIFELKKAFLVSQINEGIVFLENEEEYFKMLRDAFTLLVDTTKTYLKNLKDTKYWMFFTT